MLVKILFIHNRYKQTGGEDVALELEASILKEKGHDVQTMIFENKSINGFLSKINAAISSVYNFASAKKLSVIIKHFQPDIIHIHNLFFIASPSLTFVARKYKIPVVLSLHNYRLICANAILLRNNEVCELCIHKKIPLAGIRYKCYRNSAIESAVVTAITSIHKILNTWQNKITTYIALSKFSRHILLHSSLRISDHKMVIKPNFVPDFGEGIFPRENFYLFVGRIVKEKGVYVLAKAFAGMPEHSVIVIGDGPELKTLQEEFRTFANIYFTGRLEKQQVREYMKRCKALICSSIWYESAPLTMIEAFSSGTPVIASVPGEAAESVNDGYNGFHFIPGDIGDLQKKIRLFDTEASKSTLLYKNARTTYVEKYHPEIHYNAILKIYQNAMANKNA